MNYNLLKLPFDIESIPSPCYVVDQRLLKNNALVLHDIQEKTGCQILLALKAFSMFGSFDTLRPYLAGTTASGLFEAKLGREKFGKMVHTYSPGYSPRDIREVAALSDHVVFNSVSQFRTYINVLDEFPDVSVGLRLNPEHSEVSMTMYDPCANGTRFGITVEELAELTDAELNKISGFLIHNLCQQNSDALTRTVTVIEDKFGPYLSRAKWLNLGGGHWFNHPDYDYDLLYEILIYLRDTYDVQVILEPGEGVTLNTGYLIATVLDIVHREIDICILDTSASAHMPDVLEMPYRPIIVNSGIAGQYAYTYRMGGVTCLSGDVIGEYSFEEPLQVGQKLIFMDMSHYTMVKNTTFNGVPLPSIGRINQDGIFELVKNFGYEDFQNRLS